MESLEVVSLNIWSILLSLANLLILYFILKKFVYKPVSKMLAQRRNEIDRQYEQAQEAQDQANANKQRYEAVMESAQQEADAVVHEAEIRAERNASRVLNEAQSKADSMIRHADEEIALEKRKAAADMKKEMADISIMLAEKVLGRQATERDARKWVSDAIDQIGNTDE